MDEHEVLQQLLNLESKAAGLVNDAQAEADRRIAEGEKQNRAHYDSIYSAEVAGLEASYTENIARVRQDYSTQLEEYLESLKAISLDRASFASLAEKLLFAAKAAQPAGNAE
jgi:F0F1-type ATP synthase membrane subunit b/b'